MSVPFQPQRIVAAISKYRVKCVLIGGLGAVLHGSPATTNDADLCPDRSPANLARLATMLRSLKARIRTEGVDDGIPFDCSAEFFGNVELINLVTNAGDVDIAFRPAGSRGYEELITRSVEFEIDGHSLQVASLDDIIHSKETADRPKDRAVLPILLALREEISRRG